jgi:hypothetical protein
MGNYTAKTGPLLSSGSLMAFFVERDGIGEMSSIETMVPLISGITKMGSRGENYGTSTASMIVLKMSLLTLSMTKRAVKSTKLGTN